MNSLIKGTIMLGVGLMMGVYVSPYIKSHSMPQRMIQEKKVRYWVAPMDANYKRDKPGKSPMGMDLVPVYETGTTDKHSGVTINAKVQNNISVKIARVTRKTLVQRIEAVGYVASDEMRISKVTTFIDGWVRSLQIGSNGESVKRRQLLFKLYSPTLISAQQEYLLALALNPKLLLASEKKLTTLGFSQQQINALKKSKKVRQTFAVYAKEKGTVSELAIREGMYIKPEQTLMAISDLSSVWLEADVPASDQAKIKIGQMALATFEAYPNKQWMGKIMFIQSKLNLQTRTLRVRLQFPNPDFLLKPNMFADISINTKSLNNVLTIPSSAVIHNHGLTYVIKTDDATHFSAQEIRIGESMEKRFQVLDGLAEDDCVVVNGQFLIDSESNVQDSLKRLAVKKKKQSLTQEVYGTGKVLAIDNKKRTITLDHNPIQSLDMPSMIMSFSLAKHLDIKKLKVHDQIHFRVSKIKDSHFIIHCFKQGDKP